MKKEFKLSLSDLKIVDGDRGTNYPKKTDFKNEGYCLFLNAGNITKNGFNDSRCEFITKEKSDLLGKGVVQENDIILTTRGSVGNFVYIDNEIIKKYPRIRVNSGMVIIRNTNNNISTEFLYYLLNSNTFSKEIDKSISGGVLKQLPINAIKKMSLTYTEDNKEDQIEIIKKIIKAENHISNIKKLIEKIEIRNQYYADKLLNGELTIQNEKIVGNSIPLNKTVITTLFDLKMGETILRNQIEENKIDDNFIAVYSATEENKIFGYIDKNKVKKILCENDMILAARGSIGSLKLTDDIKTSTQTTIQLVSKTKYSSYLAFKYLENKRNVVFKPQGAAIPQITIDGIKDIEINLINNKEVEIFLRKMDEEKEKIEKLLKLEEKRFEWISDKLLSGDYIIED